MGELLAELARIAGHANTAIVEHAPSSQTYTWIKPASEYVSNSLFDLPAVSDEDLAAQRRETRNRLILHTSVVVSVGVMFAAILLRLYQANEVKPPSSQARARAASEVAEMSGLTAANQRPAPHHPLPSVDTASDLGSEMRGQLLPRVGLPNGKPGSNAPLAGTSMIVPAVPAERSQSAAQAAPIAAPKATPEVVQKPPASAPQPMPTAVRRAAAPVFIPQGASPASAPGAPSHPEAQRPSDALDRMRIE
jgi:hypothetical protein